MKPLDVLLLVPMPPAEAYFVTPSLRRLIGPPALAILSAGHALERFVGRDLGFAASQFPKKHVVERSLTAVALATSLDRAGLEWAVLDPGARTLSEWRSMLDRYRNRHPRVIGISTTYFTTVEWLEALIARCRAHFPDAAVVIGGYMYGTSAEAFLALPGDVLVIGEGEARLSQIVQSVIAGEPLESIPGLYLRRPNGRLHFTGTVDPLRLNDLPSPDWLLSRRIDPSADPVATPLSLGMETQRGCVFKCEFCTFRTLTAPNELSVAASVERIMDTAPFCAGSIVPLADATATFPRMRWTEILDGLIARGGSPHPISAYARVSDIDAAVVARMARANVRSLFIGQESGSQEILAAMRKGTHVKQVRPAIDAIAGSGIRVVFGFIHGFPGESAETMQATRDMICSLNERHRDRPVVHQYALSPFTPQDLASVSFDPHLAARTVPSQRAIEEVMATLIASTRVPHAPVMFGIGPSSPGAQFEGVPRMSFDDYFRWAKAIQRGVAIFLEAQMEGRSRGDGELAALREQILAPMLPVRRAALPARWKLRFYNTLRHEIEREERDGAGLLTRVAAAFVFFGADRAPSAFVRRVARPASDRSDAPADAARLSRSLAREAVQAPALRNARASARKT